MELWLVRHGRTAWSDEGRYAGWTDLALTAEGEAQARDLARLLPAGPDVSAWSSDLLRCTATARLAGLEPVTDPRLRELSFGALEGATWDELTPQQQADVVAFDPFVAPGGESVAELRTRVRQFLDELAPGRHIVFTHGGVVRMLLRDTGADRWVSPAQVEHMAWPAEPPVPPGR
ncbi:MAG TPA: histidine phosphatase family protein [Acidimicrobiales bacterium]|nr:histidine phosphatase family protein [Acidimicrobiales bacterium]